MDQPSTEPSAGADEAADAAADEAADAAADAVEGTDVTDGAGHVELLVVTGLSGAGRSTVAHSLEDLGWYVVDNLPPAMLGALSGLVARAGTAVPRVAVVLDARTRALSDYLLDSGQQGAPGADAGQSLAGDLGGVLLGSQDAGVRRRVLFLEASDDVLVRRFESVRRPHPLQGEGRVLDGIVAEREMLREVRAAADLVIDTTDRNIHQLGAAVADLFGEHERTRLRLTLVSFGFKYGLPTDADHVVDVRFLPNPFWVPALRGHTGREASVADYVLHQEGAEEFCQRYAAALEPVIAGYRRENRGYATVAIGCTGGKHRSVAMGERLGRLLRERALAAPEPGPGAAGAGPAPAPGAGPAVTVRVTHRDLGRE